MKSLLLSTALAALRLYAGGGLFDRIAAEVLRLTTTTALTGEQKMAEVLAFVRAEALTLSTTLARAIIELVLLQAKQARAS